MQDIKLTMNWLNEKLESLCVYNGKNLEMAMSFKNSLKDTLRYKLQCELWELSEFFVLAIAFNLMEELCSNNKTVGSIYRHEWASGTGIIRPLMAGDVIEVRDKFLQYYHEKIELLKKLSLSKKINSPASPVVWLEMAESIKAELYVQRQVTTYEMSNDNPSTGIECKKPGGMSELIMPEVAKLIRYKTFSLNEQEENNKDEYPYVYTLSELASRWGTNDQNVIACCGRSDYFWPYITITDGMRLYERSLPITTAMINENLRNGNLQEDYKYGFKGYARLTKKSDLPHKITLEYFHSNKVIDPKAISAGKKYSSCIWIEPPLCKYILGVYQFIEVIRHIEPILYFLADEIHAFEKSDDFSKLFVNSKVNPLVNVAVAISLQAESETNINYYGVESELSSIGNINSTTVDQNEMKFGEEPFEICGTLVGGEELLSGKENKNRIFKNGNCHEIHYDGQRIVTKTSKGWGYVESLIKKIRQEIHVNELECIVNKVILPDLKISLSEIEDNQLSDVNNAEPDDVSDERAIKEVNKALAAIREDLKIAREIADTDRIDKLEEDEEKYKQYLSGAIGKHYKPRKMSDHNEKARKRVFAAIKDALKSVKLSHNQLHDHLSQSIKTGEFCVYKPVKEVEWV